MSASAPPPAALRLRPRWRPLAVYVAVLAVCFAASALATYVYSYSPARDTVGVSLQPAAEVADPADAGQGRTLAGTVAAVEDGRLVIATDTGEVTVTLPPGTPVDDLRAATAIAEGTMVNVGVLPTQYGLVLTGIVGLEDAP